ncbi:MAG: hypothetical protein FWH53_06510 [Leptospirales bacterium]|nr:hypothetical protein [Leptospirales bacterium]
MRISDLAILFKLTKLKGGFQGMGKMISLSLLLSLLLMLGLPGCSSDDDDLVGLDLLDDESFKTFDIGYNQASTNTVDFLYIRLPEQNRLNTDILKSHGLSNADSIAYLDKVNNLPVRKSETITGQMQTNAKAYNIGENWLTKKFAGDHTPKWDPENDFKNSDDVDARNLYSYLIAAASDGFSWRDGSNKGLYPDLSWEGELEKAYITTLADDGRVIYNIPFVDDNPTTRAASIINWINQRMPTNNNFRVVKTAEHIFALRTINVQLGSTLNANRSNLVRIQIGAIEKHSIQEGGDGKLAKTDYKYINTTDLVNIDEGGTKWSKTAIKVNDNFLTDYVKENIGARTFTTITVVCVDGYEVEYDSSAAYDEIANAYYIPEDERIVTINPSTMQMNTSGKKKAKWPVTIIINTSTSFEPKDYELSTKQRPAIAIPFR